MSECATQLGEQHNLGTAGRHPAVCVFLRPQHLLLSSSLCFSSLWDLRSLGFTACSSDCWSRSREWVPATGHGVLETGPSMGSQWKPMHCSLALPHLFCHLPPSPLLFPSSVSSLPLTSMMKVRGGGDQIISIGLDRLRHIIEAIISELGFHVCLLKFISPFMSPKLAHLQSSPLQSCKIT